MTAPEDEQDSQNDLSGATSHQSGSDLSCTALRMCGLDVTSSVRTNVLSQSVVITRTMDFCGRTGGISAILPYAALDASSAAFRASNQGVSDVGFLWQMNIFGGPALTKEQFRSHVALGN